MATLQLWISALGTERTGWTRTGTTPYLDAQDQPTHYVYSILKKAEIGDFDFQNTTETGTINSVTLYIYGKTAIANNQFGIWDGSVWTEYNPTLPATWGWANIAVPVLNTWAKINGAKLYILHANSTSQTDIDAAYLLVDYTSTTVSSQESIVNFDPTVSATKTAGGVPNTQTVQESIKLFDVFGPSLASFQRQIQDYGNLGDTLTYRTSIQQQMIEYITLSDTILATVAIIQIVQDSVQLGDVFSFVSSLQKQIQESIKLDDVISYNVSVQQQIIEYAKLWDTASATTGLPPATQTIYDYMNIVDSIIFQNIFMKTVNENFRLDELFNTRTQLTTTETINEWIKIFESATTAPRYLRFSYEWMKLSDSISERVISVRQLQEWMKLFDVSTQTSSFMRVWYENTIISEATNIYLSIVREPREYLSISDFRDTRTLFITTLNDYILLFDAATTTPMISKTSLINEWIKIFESIQNRISITQQFNEYQKLWDTSETKASFSKQIFDYAKIFDVATETQTVFNIQTINEWLNMFETQTRLIVFNRQIVEYTTIFDTITATTEELSNLILQLIKCVEIP